MLQGHRGSLDELKALNNLHGVREKFESEYFAFDVIYFLRMVDH